MWMLIGLTHVKIGSGKMCLFSFFFFFFVVFVLVWCYWMLCWLFIERLKPCRISVSNFIKVKCVATVLLFHFVYSCQCMLKDASFWHPLCRCVVDLLFVFVRMMIFVLRLFPTRPFQLIKLIWCDDRPFRCKNFIRVDCFCTTTRTERPYHK